ncbi:STAS domain-containing protein [Actinophytocola sp.]|uniref:STAS domain-containing protein n=1 Tax=Actinophytocola sp. TaxID=1872138 RepID=UPI002ED29DCD
MAFNASLSTKGDTAVITLVGDLDDANVTTFRDKVAAASRAGIDRLILDMSQLDTLSAAGLRGLAFAREKMADDVDIIVVSPNEDVRAAIEGADFQLSVTIADTVPR